MTEMHPRGRRKFLQLGLFGVMCLAGGCGAGDEPEKVTTPALPGGARKRLDEMKETAESKAKTKTKKK
jgi:hypothetical protein